jgi:tRNA(Ile)-lysidine synthase
MIKLVGSLPRSLTVAVSGGVDSMVLLDFLSRNHQVTAVFFHHDTDTSEQALSFLKSQCLIKNIELVVGHIKNTRSRRESLEEYWRNERYQFLENFPLVATAHHLDDCVETWIWSSLNGNPKLIPYRRNNVVRPLLITAKKEIREWAENKSVAWQEDHSNQNVKFTRNYIRQELMPHALRVNPGLKKTIKKMLINKYF